MNDSKPDFISFFRNWAFLHGIVNILGWLISLYTGTFGIWLMINFISFLYYIYRLPDYVPSLPWYWGYANWVTLVRLAFLLCIFFIHNKLNPLTFAGLLVTFLILDGLDGYLARHFHHTSKAGESLDMETDALFVFLLSTVLYLQGRLPFWIMIPGGMRYLYELALHWIPSSKVELPSKRVRSTIALLFFISLILPFVTIPEIYFPLSIVSSSLVLISFSISAFHRMKFFGK